MTEVGVATNGATEGTPVGDDVWTSPQTPTLSRSNIGDMLETDPIDDATPLRHGVPLFTTAAGENDYMSAAITSLRFGSMELWFTNLSVTMRVLVYTDSLPVTLQEGRNVLLVMVGRAIS